MKKNKKSISFIISPKGFGKSIQFSVSTLFLKISFMIFFCLLIIAIAGTYISYDANFKQAAYQQLKRENKKYQQDLKDLDERMDIIKVQISSLIEKEQDLKGILGPVKSRKKKKNKK